jgi:hypothetical protein
VVFVDRETVEVRLEVKVVMLVKNERTEEREVTIDRIVAVVVLMALVMHPKGEAAPLSWIRNRGILAELLLFDPECCGMAVTKLK